MKEEMDERRSFSPVARERRSWEQSRGGLSVGIHRESERIWIELEVYSWTVP